MANLSSHHLEHGLVRALDDKNMKQKSPAASHSLPSICLACVCLAFVFCRFCFRFLVQDVAIAGSLSLGSAFHGCEITPIFSTIRNLDLLKLYERHQRKFAIFIWTVSSLMLSGGSRQSFDIIAVGGRPHVQGWLGIRETCSVGNNHSLAMEAVSADRFVFVHFNIPLPLCAGPYPAQKGS